jgi:hypothetical protein
VVFRSRSRGFGQEEGSEEEAGEVSAGGAEERAVPSAIRQRGWQIVSGSGIYIDPNCGISASKTRASFGFRYCSPQFLPVFRD